jgi:hypothetical protein
MCIVQIAPDQDNLLTFPELNKCSRWYLFSGPIMLRNQRYRLPLTIFRRIVTAAMRIFAYLVFANI